MNTKPKNIYAFIDSQNLNLGVRSLGWKVDWRKFRQYLRNKYHVIKAYLFIGHIDGNEALYTFLQECGFVLVFKPTLEAKVGDKTIVKGNVDAELVLHTMIHYRNYDQAIIVSGDGDFHCLIEYLVENNKLYRVLAPNRKYSGLLRKYYKYISLISSLKSSLALTKMTKINVRSKP